MTMNIKPFRFNLRKISAKSERALGALFNFFPRTGKQCNLYDAIWGTLHAHLSIKGSHRLEDVNQIDFESFCRRLPDPALAVVIGTSFGDKKIIANIDVGLAGFFIERLLGGQATSFPPPKQFTDIEQGVLQYLILQFLEHLYRLCGQDSRVHFRFEKFVSDPKKLRDIERAEETILVLIVKLTIGKSDGFIKLAIPAAIAEKLSLDAKNVETLSPEEKNFLLERLGNLDFISTTLWADGGRATLSAGDIKNLEIGDVIILDETKLAMDGNNISGHVILRAGLGYHGGFVANLTLKPKKAFCQITDVCKGENIL